MHIEVDPAKNTRNIEERGISFELARSFDFDTALIRSDARRDYGEPRYQALGMIDQRLYFLAFTLRSDSLRVISLRKANTREIRLYEQEA